MAVVVPPRNARGDVPPRSPQVHIGSIEVTITPAAPPPPQPPPPQQPVEVAPTGRLSRPSANYGFGQG
jgi:hypothetical protein